ncbi:hypothetical protein L249_2344 [Ophiocordyceps polyrhachis-furcata BCC 54312]|uniref:Uncharacterized protein n=1 Tax=Ophiocordyceps polyrhachis-furcata BCC 54312 TaxID=1330021 RepID=A0A367LRN1_9HYPO|nr:hypothetical protein L249_2344 [Ophiocordyceps polyrhachis-furcata BCC 54312]
MTVLTRLAAAAGFLATTASAATVNYDFNISWVRANPDGAHERPVIGINGRWPIPRIEANVGDNVVVLVRNQLGNQTTSLHFHGLFMRGSPHMDGPDAVTQCPIPPGAEFTYNFTIDQPGTYWYHSHTHAQYPDGLRGPLIIHDPKSPHANDVDEELVLTLSDWYHDEMQTLIPRFLSKNNPTGAEPVPNAALINETQNLDVRVKPRRKYLLRIVNMGAFAAQYFWIQGHSMSIVEVDGVYTKPAEANIIYLSAAQRVSVIVETRAESSANFPIVASMDTQLFDVLPDDLNYNSTGWLVYDAEKPRPEADVVQDLQDAAFDDMHLVPWDGMKLLPEPTREIQLDVKMDNLIDGANYAFFGQVTYAAPKVPSLYTALSAGDLASNPAVYGEYTQPFVLEKGDVVQVVVNNLDPGRHPFHLHGHNFQALYRAPEENGTFVKEDAAGRLPDVPMRRDTLVVWPNSHIVLRFRADNPGVWLFHCHIEWHVVSGLVATFVEDPHGLAGLSIPQDHLAACRQAGIPTAGNAAGNEAQLLDLTGQNEPPASLPEGFTPRGIAALVLSCVAGLVGVAVVAWYGFAASTARTPPAAA